MELKDLSQEARVCLQPVKYEFESVTGDDWDDNWLDVAFMSVPKSVAAQKRVVTNATENRFCW